MGGIEKDYACIARYPKIPDLTGSARLANLPAVTQQTLSGGATMNKLVPGLYVCDVCGDRCANYDVTGQHVVTDECPNCLNKYTSSNRIPDPRR